MNDSMDKLSLEDLFTRIATGKAIIQLTNNDLVVVKDPSIYDRQMANMIYKQELVRLLEDGVSSREDILAKLESTGLWTPNDTAMEEWIPQELVRTKEGIAGCEFRSVTKSALLRKKETLENQYRALQHKKDGVLSVSAESLANNLKHQYLIFRLSYKVDDTPYFPSKSFSDFLNTYSREANEIMENGFYPRNIDEADIRKLARNEPWRSVWMVAQKTGNLFGRPSIEITDLQRALVTWSLIYDATHESTECPEANVFDDDDMFDAWLTGQSNKRRSGQPTKDYGPKVLKSSDRTEVGIFVETPEDAQKVYAMNSPMVNRTIAQNTKIIQEKGEVVDWSLPNSQQIIRQKAVQNAGVK